MQERKDGKASDQERRAKERYEAPKLRDYGDVRDLTQGQSGKPTDGGARFPA